MSRMNVEAMDAVLEQVRDERFRQHENGGEQNHRDGTDSAHEDFIRLDIEYISNAPSEPGRREALLPVAAMADAAKYLVDHAAKRGVMTMAQILTKEFFEALAESDPDKLRTELIQVAAVAVQWVEKIDRDAAKKPVKSCALCVKECTGACE